MKKRTKALLSILTAAALTAGLLTWTARLVERKASRVKYEPFFAQEADFDVLFFGSSHMVNDIYPMELWEDHGIVSYNLGGHGSQIATSYWILQNALRYTTPRLVVLDCYFLSGQTKLGDYFRYSHQSFDAFPLTWTKIQAVWDLFDDETFDEQLADGTLADEKERSRLGLLWDFSQYHERWKELGKGDFEPEPTKEKGAESRIGVARPRETGRSEEPLQTETTGMRYLRRIIEDCQDRGIEVLLIYLPFPATAEDWREANTARQIAQQYGVGYVNFLDMDEADFTTDCYDSVSHLNPSGARKVTDWLGAYIRERYDVPDRRDDPVYAGWYEDYEAYTNYKLGLLESQKELKNYLMLLQDSHLSFCLYLAPSTQWAGTYRALLDNIGVDVQALPSEGPALAVADRLTGDTRVLRPGEQAGTCFGTVALAQTQDGSWAVYVGDRQELTLAANAAAGAVVVSNAGGRLSGTAQFSSAVYTETKIEK